MCGICGVFHYGEPEPVDERALRAMTASMIHRGPDDDGFFVHGSLGLGMRRLSIIDVEGGAQPITNETGSVVVVLNGEIYNFRELRRELESRGHVFRTRSDTEVVAHAYEQWGFDAFSRLNGMFGVAVWDADAQVLFVARDPFGIKPLYYWDDGTTVLFGSEVRTILAQPRVRRSVEVGALAALIDLTYVPAPRTAFEDISKLLPGHALVVGRSSCTVRRFNRRVPRQLSSSSEADIVTELRSAIATAVERQMVADVPIGALLSGGIDSATIAAIMTECSSQTVATFTVGFGSQFKEDELVAARATAQRLGANHHEIEITADEYESFLPRSIWHLEEPVATTSTLALYRVCELARRHVKVVLTGQGADEAFAGYPRYLGERYGFVYRRIPSGVRSTVVAPLVERLPRNERLKRAVRSVGVEDARERMQRIYRVVDDDVGRSLLRPGVSPTDFTTHHMWHDDVEGLGDLEALLYVDARTSLADNLLLFGDKMSMAVSLEARVPFLDLDLMELVESIPARLKIRRLEQKSILKKAIAPWVPPDVIRRKKVGFATPVDEWLRGAFRAAVEARLLVPDSACSTYFERDVVRRLIAEHVSGRHDHKRVLFSLLTFELWHEQFVAPASWPVST